MDKEFKDLQEICPWKRIRGVAIFCGVKGTTNYHKPCKEENCGLWISFKLLQGDVKDG